jgi:hypothetical protein
MNTPTKVAGFAVGLLAVFGAATGLGALVGPVGGTGATGTAAAGSHDTDHSSVPLTASALPGGLMVSQDGYTLDLLRRQLPAGASTPVELRILGPDGAPVTRYTREHGKDLHVIAVRRDLTGYQHVHPQLAADGTWSVPVQLARGGSYRIFADFTPAARTEGLTLGADLSVAGRYDPQPLPTMATTARVDDYSVALAGTLVPGQESELTLSVSRNGRPVTDLQPYLEAYGHLVALRDRDLAYLHVHPAGSPDDGRTAAGPDITFFATAPSSGAYRLFLDFRHGDQVRTAEFTVSTDANGTGSRPDRPSPADPAGPTREAAPQPSSSTEPTADHDETGHGHG